MPWHLWLNYYAQVHTGDLLEVSFLYLPLRTICRLHDTKWNMTMTITLDKVDRKRYRAEVKEIEWEMETTAMVFHDYHCYMQDCIQVPGKIMDIKVRKVDVEQREKARKQIVGYHA